MLENCKYKNEVSCSGECAACPEGAAECARLEEFWDDIYDMLMELRTQQHLD